MHITSATQISAFVSLFYMSFGTVVYIPCPGVKTDNTADMTFISTGKSMFHRPNSAFGTRSASRHAVLHASATGTAVSDGHAARQASDQSLPPETQQRQATSATQTGTSRDTLPCMVFGQA